MYKYSPELVQSIRDNYNNGNKKELAKKLGISYPSLVIKAAALGINKIQVNNRKNKLSRTCVTCKNEYPRTRQYFNASKNYRSICISCERIQAKKRDSKPEIFLSKLIKGITRNKKRNIKEFDLDFDFVMALYIRQQRKCAITNIEMTTLRGKGHLFSNVSIDRIDSSRGYTRDNVQLICFWANIAKGNLSMEKFRELISMANTNLSLI